MAAYYPLDEEVATKDYVNSRDFFAAVKGVFQSTPNQFKEVKFNMASSDLLDKDLTASADMFIKVTVEVLPTTGVFEMMRIRININDTTNLETDLMPLQPMSLFLKVKKNDVLKVLLRARSDTKLQPHVYVRKIEYHW